MKFLAGLLAIISSFFAGDSLPESQTPPLNTTVVAYHQTYFAPAVAEPGNFPWAKKTSVSVDVPAPAPKITPPAPPAPVLSPSPAPVVPPAQVSISDTYLANPEPVVDWYMPVTVRGDSAIENNSIPEMTFSREFWRIEVMAYWMSKEFPKPPIPKDYFKLEIYEKGTDKLVFTMISGSEETIHKFQAFKKPGTYYFKVYLKSPSQYEITFTFH